MKYLKHYFIAMILLLSLFPKFVLAQEIDVPVLTDSMEKNMIKNIKYEGMTGSFYDFKKSNPNFGYYVLYTSFDDRIRVYFVEGDTTTVYGDTGIGINSKTNTGRIYYFDRNGNYLEESGYSGFTSFDNKRFRLLLGSKGDVPTWLNLEKADSEDFKDGSTFGGIFDMFKWLANKINEFLIPIHDFHDYFKPKLETMFDFLKTQKMLLSDIKEELIKIRVVFTTGITGITSWDGGINFEDGYFIKLIKSSRDQIIETMEKLFPRIGDHKFVDNFDYTPGLLPYGVIGSSDGVFVQLIKYQITRVVDSIEKIVFKIDYDKIEKMLIDNIKAFDFDELRRIVDKIKFETFDFDKLEKILPKFKPFDFDKLEEILKDLDLGSEIDSSEDGWFKQLIKSGFSLIETAIKSIEKVITEAIKGLVSIGNKILDFLDNLLDKIIALIIPKNLDFVGNKLDGVKNDIDVKFPFVKSLSNFIQNAFSTRQVAFEDIKVTLPQMFGGTTTNIPLSILNTVASYIKPVFTAFILLEFLIDFYKWFYRKGEVIE